jgi:hypothetical protein
MPDEDFDDTIIVPSRPLRLTRTPDGDPAENTIIVARPDPRQPAKAPSPVGVPAPEADPAPPVYRVRVGNASAVGLEAPIYVGRKPSVPRIVVGPTPRLIDVPSPRHEVSATHVEVRQNGSSVIVTDLGSTNGTLVRAPGSEPLRLRQGESVVVIPGTVVDIGDGNCIDILPTQRFTS